MSQFLMKSILYGCCTVRFSPTTSNLGFVRDPNVYLLRWFSSGSNRQSFTVPYLKDSLGFSSQSALSVSRYVKLYTPKNADQVIEFFKGRSFSETQISRLVRGHPKVLLYNAEKTILPKLEFLESKGILGPELAKMLSTFPTILSCSLVYQIMPAYNFLRNLFQSDGKLIMAIKRCPNILIHNIEKNVSPNINILREHGVPDSNIATLMRQWPLSFAVDSDGYRKIVEKVEDMRFDASKRNFVLAVYALSMSKSAWENKVDAYKKWGWSEEDVLNAFRRSPSCMMISEDKIMACMDLFINEMGWRPCLIARCPVLVTLSLKKRLIPRYLVFQVLLSKGLVKKPLSTFTFKQSSERFLQKFVFPYKEEAPELLKLYTEKLDLAETPVTDEKAGKIRKFLSPMPSKPHV